MDRGGKFATSDAMEKSIESSWRILAKNGVRKKKHEYIRKILPKGSSFDELSQADINKMLWHINSAARESLNG